LIEEIKAESLVRSLQNFARFLDSAALINTDQINFASVSSDAGLPSKEEFKNIRKIIVSLEPHKEPHKRMEDQIEIWPAQAVFSALWNNEVL
jgi:hypothetical protein